MEKGEMKLGDIVRLRTKGPPMTVEHNDRGMIRCVWFEGADLHRDTFRAEALVAHAAALPR